MEMVLDGRKIRRKNYSGTISSLERKILQQFPASNENNNPHEHNFALISFRESFAADVSLTLPESRACADYWIPRFSGGLFCAC